MSRIGNMPIPLPQGVDCVINDDGTLLISKNNESGVYLLPDYINAELQDRKITFNSECSKALLGLHRAKLNNLVLGIDTKFHVVLDIKGVGYRAALSNSYLTLFLGFSHGIKYKVPEYLAMLLQKPTELLISGIDKEKLNMVAHDICSIRKYNPYKRKGISIRGEYVFVKEMKKK